METKASRAPGVVAGSWIRSTSAESTLSWFLYTWRGEKEGKRVGCVSARGGRGGHGGKKAGAGSGERLTCLKTFSIDSLELNLSKRNWATGRIFKRALIKAKMG